MIDQAWQAYTDLLARNAREDDLRRQALSIPLGKVRTVPVIHKPQGCTLFDVSGRFAGTRPRIVNSTGLTPASQFVPAHRSAA